MNNIKASELWRVSEASFEFGSPWSINQFEDDLKNQSSNWLVERNEEQEIIAFLQYRVMFDEAELFNLAVIPSYWSNGLGQKLFNQLTSALLGANVSQLFLEVRESNQRARLFYQKNGMVEVSKRKHYYHHPVENGLILMKEIK